MALYRLIEESDNLILKNDIEVIVEEAGNSKWDEYIEWLSFGNIPDPAKAKPESINSKWTYFIEDLRNTTAFNKIYTASTLNPSIATAFSLLVSTLNSPSPNYDDLNFAFSGVDSALDNDDRLFIKSKLSKYGIAIPSSLEGTGSIAPEVPYITTTQAPTLKTKVGHAWFRNLNDTQTNVTTKTKLLIDGLETAGTFNSTGYIPWDSSSSRITPQNKNQMFMVRINYIATPQISGTLINTAIEVLGGLVGSTIYNNERFIRKLAPYQVSEFTSLFVTDPLLINGAEICISATEPVSITKPNIYINLIELV